MNTQHHGRSRRDDSRRFGDLDSDWGQPVSRQGQGKMRRFRHEPYKRQPATGWFDWDGADSDD